MKNVINKYDLIAGIILGMIIGILLSMAVLMDTDEATERVGQEAPFVVEATVVPTFDHRYKAGTSELVYEPAKPTFDELLDAIEWVESRGDPNAIGDNGNAVGAYQIHEICVDEVNRILKGSYYAKSFTYEDRWDKAKSREMSLIHNKHWSDFALQVADLSREETFARSHQGAFGWKLEITKPYWNKVKARMESVK